MVTFGWLEYEVCVTDTAPDPVMCRIRSVQAGLRLRRAELGDHTGLGGRNAAEIGGGLLDVVAEPVARYARAEPV